MKQKKIALAVRCALGASALLIASANAQTSKPQATPAAAAKPVAEQILVTGSRVAKIDFDSNSPIITISAEELVKHQDITLETFLNTLPQVNPASSTTSNNPASTQNSGQASIDLRGLGSNRNLILVDGRRPMVSTSNQTVDLNTIPLALIDSIEIITGGAGAVYGADAISGVVNIKLKKKFEGLDIRVGNTDSTVFKDARERSASVVMGGNFANSRGNAVIGFEYSDREGVIKKQRDFAAIATSTTTFFPEGTYRPAATNLPSQAAVNALYGQSTYGGAAAGTVPNSSAHSFNSDGSLFYPGIFNSSRDVLNFRYPVDTGVNTRLFPDVYSYNFDAVNILVLPLERKSVMAKFDYRFANDIEVFSSFANTLYTSTSAIAPTPVSTVTVAAPNVATATQASSALITSGQNVGPQLIVPTTNPFISADLRALLNSRTGDDPRIIGSGAAEPFLMRWRTLALGLRTSDLENTVTQYSGGAKGNLPFDGWRWEANVSEGRTKIVNAQGNNVDTNRLLNALGAPDGGRSLCEGGINPFGRQSLSTACQNFLRVSGAISTTFSQTIGQAFVTGELAQTKQGALSMVLGVESRAFKYDFNPGSAAGPISGFNTQTPSGGSNNFRDIFGELSMPLLRDQPFAKLVEAHIAYRSSQSQSRDAITGTQSASRRDGTWAFDLSWEPNDTLRARASAQKSVRAPNFAELFAGQSGSPQIYDPCSVTSAARTTGSNAARLATLCQNAGSAGGLGGAVSTHVQTPGTQAAINLVGNPNLKPETGDSMTLGLVWAPRFTGTLKGLRASMDYYSIKIKNQIAVADTNEYIADCYNFYGNNSTYNPSYGNCTALSRQTDIVGVNDPTTASGAYPTLNGGKIETSGIDTQVSWGMPLLGGQLDMNWHLNYLLKYRAQSLTSLPTQDFVGTIPYFGAGFGQAFPKLKSTLTTAYRYGNWSADVRMRFIDKMSNRMGAIFPGESFTGVPSTTYWDLGFGWRYEKMLNIRIGLLNAVDQKPRTYSPNVQSGTDPSTYDVIGRRLLVQMNFKF